MSTPGTALTQATLDALFPATRADEFFDALFGEAEDGAYDIRLALRKVEANAVSLDFELHQRPGKCLVCSLTYGLPQVFQRHPIINVAGLAERIGHLLGWPPQSAAWTLGRTQERNPALHCIPLEITRAAS